MIFAEKINKRSPYKVIQADDNSVLFVTKNGVQYSAGFAPDYSFMDAGVYQFFLSNINHVHDSEDEDIFATVAIIIEEFFAQGQNVMLYICDTMDSRQAVRDRLFRIWFNTYMISMDFTMFNDHVCIDNVQYFASIILRRNHPMHNEIVGLFHNFVQTLPNKLETQE